MKAIMNKGKLLIDGIPVNIELPSNIKQLLDNQTNNIHLTLRNGVIYYKSTLTQALIELRNYRSVRIQEIDYLFLSDNSYLTTATEKTELKAERKMLREITDGVKTVEDVLAKVKEITKLG